jgi:D-3-phosphoglycerate dehydrogenase / 2-oxoglutarate reductase
MKILITESDGFNAEAVKLLRSNGHTVALGHHNYSSLQKVIARYDCVIVRLGIEFDERMLRKASALKYIVTSTTGLNHIDEKYCHNNDIKVISLKGDTSFLRTITSTAELTWALILNVNRFITPAARAVCSGQWNRDEFIGRDIQGKTIGIIGLGRLGSMIARYGQAFGADIIYFDPHVTTKRYKRCKTLRDLASESDIVTVHVPLSDDTESLINKSFFRHCKKGAVFINTSRGEIVNEVDLLSALTSNRLSGAGLDVLRDEVGKKNMTGSLIKYAKNNTNLIITPHIGGATIDAMRKTEEHVVKKLIDTAK